MKIKFEDRNKFMSEWIKISIDYAEKFLNLKIPKEKQGGADIWLANRMERIPKKMPRQIVVSDAFVCPDELKDGWNNLKQKIENGEDLYPHVSRQIGKISSRDPMLMHWDINHFHLGVTPDPKHPGLVLGGSNIVFAHVDNDAFYAIALLDHDHWEDINLIDIIKRNWPKNRNIISEFVFLEDYSFDDVLKLRKHQINVPTPLSDGSHYMGFGETLGGTSARATQKALWVRRLFGIAQEAFARDFELFFPEIQIKENEIIKVRIEMNKNYSFVVHLIDYDKNFDLINIPSMLHLIEEMKG